MLKLLLDFQGVIHRREFLLGNLALMAWVFVLCMGLVLILLTTGLVMPAGLPAQTGLLTVVIIVAILWPVLALYTKRLRSLGVDGAVGVALAIGPTVATLLVTVAALITGPSPVLTTINTTLQLIGFGVFLACCFVAARGGTGEGPMASAAQATTSLAPPTPRTAFGRRGV